VSFSLSINYQLASQRESNEELAAERLLDTIIQRGGVLSADGQFGDARSPAQIMEAAATAAYEGAMRGALQVCVMHDFCPHL
jgi:hypothetical protein